MALKVVNVRPIVDSPYLAVQWNEDIDAPAIIEWLWDEAGVDARYDGTVAGAYGPNGEDWGEFTVDEAEVPPYGWIVIRDSDECDVVNEGLFSSLYQKA